MKVIRTGFSYHAYDTNLKYCAHSCLNNIVTSSGTVGNSAILTASYIDINTGMESGNWSIQYGPYSSPNGVIAFTNQNSTLGFYASYYTKIHAISNGYIAQYMLDSSANTVIGVYIGTDGYIRIYKNGITEYGNALVSFSADAWTPLKVSFTPNTSNGTVDVYVKYGTNSALTATVTGVTFGNYSKINLNPLPQVYGNDNTYLTNLSVNDSYGTVDNSMPTLVKYKYLSNLSSRVTSNTWVNGDNAVDGDEATKATITTGLITLSLADAGIVGDVAVVNVIDAYSYSEGGANLNSEVVSGSSSATATGTYMPIAKPAQTSAYKLTTVSMPMTNAEFQAASLTVKAI